MDDQGGVMSDQLLRAAEAEEQALLAELREHPAFTKLQAIRAVLAIYKGEPVGKSANIMETNAAPAATPPVARVSPRPASMTTLVVDVVGNFLVRIGRRAQVSEVMDELRIQGIDLGHRDPIPYVSSTLSHHKRFNNIRGKGYGLVEWGAHDGPPPPSPASLDDSFRNLTVDPIHGWRGVPGEALLPPTNSAPATSRPDVSEVNSQSDQEEDAMTRTRDEPE